MRLSAVLFYLVGIAVYCAMDAGMKLLVAGHPVALATFWRYALGTLFTLLIWLWSGRPPITRAILPVHLLRGLVVGLSALAFFWALSVLQLVEVVTIAFIAPLLVPPVAALLLKERMRKDSLVAGGIGFAGVLVAAGVSPDMLSGAQSPTRLLGVAAVLVSAAFYAFSLVLMRLRAARDGASTVGLLGSFFPTLVLLPFVFASTSPAALLPKGGDWWLVLAVGLFGAVALQLLALAYQRAEAQLLAPFEYSALFWASLYGWLLFAEPVAPRVLAGALLIAGACLWQMRRPAQRADPMKAPPRTRVSR